MSSQKSAYQNGTTVIGHGAALKRQTTVNLDPLSAAHVYYGESHKKKDRVRTYSSVCILHDTFVSCEVLTRARSSNLPHVHQTG